MKIEWTDGLQATATELLGLLVKKENGILFARRNKHTRWRTATAFTGRNANSRSVSAAVARWCGENPDRRRLYVFTLLAICNPDGYFWYVTAYQSGLYPDVEDCFAIDQATPEQRLFALAKAALEESA